MKIFDPYTYDLTTTAASPVLSDDPLLEVPATARGTLWHGLLEAVEGAVDLWERTPPVARSAPPANVLHAGKRRFPPGALCQQTLSGWHRLTGIELRLAVEALEALTLAGASADRWATLAEQCARVGQLYAEMEQRAGEWVALAFLRWELRLLHYRHSPAVRTLVYD